MQQQWLLQKKQMEQKSINYKHGDQKHPLGLDTYGRA